jgi:hypothetical protein
MSAVANVARALVAGVLLVATAAVALSALFWAALLAAPFVLIVWAVAGTWAAVAVVVLAAVFAVGTMVDR